jgi:methylaspartate mutase epsilon subunit
MGVYPRTPDGARRLLVEAARLAVRTGSARLIVKTTAEAYRIPSIGDNVAALEMAAAAAAAELREPATCHPADTGIYAEAQALIHAVLGLRTGLDQALAAAFRSGYLDVPYCLHPDNARRTRSYIDPAGRLQWSCIGSMPVDQVVRPAGSAELTASGLLAALSYVQRKFDRGRLEHLAVPVRSADGA